MTLSKFPLYLCLAVPVGMFLHLWLIVPRRPRFRTQAFRALPEETRRRQIRGARWTAFACEVLVCALFVGMGWIRARDERQALTSDYLSRMAEQWNRNLPQMVAPGVRADRVTVEPGRVLAVSYTVLEAAVEDFDIDAMRRELPEYMCQSPFVSEAVEKGVTLEFRVQDKDLHPVANIAIRHCASDTPVSLHRAPGPRVLDATTK